MHQNNVLRLLYTTLLFLSFSSSLTFAELVINLPDIDIQINTQNNVTTFSGNFNSSVGAGAPDIPCISKRYLLPVDTDLSTIKVSISGIETTINGIYTIPPKRPNNIDGEDVWLGEEKIVDGKMISIYSKNSFFPINKLVNYQTGKMKDYKIIDVIFSPIQYNPILKSIKKIKGMTLTISFQKEKSKRELEYAHSIKTENRIKAITLNSEDYIKEYASRSRQINNRLPGYLIITSSTLKNSLSKLDYFKNVTASTGYNVIIATESEWGSGSNMQAALNIRQWLKGYVSANDIEHVLFIGNPSSGEVPMKVASPDYSDRYKPYVDFFHGELSGDWDIDGDGNYGRYGAFNSKDLAPGGADMYAEVHVGRIPYYNSISEVDAILDKIADYKSASSNECDWRINAYMPMSDFNYYYNSKNRGDGSSFGNAMISKVFEPAGWPTTTIYGSSCNINSVVQLWNSDSYGVVLWQAHGLADYAQGLMTTSDASRLDDTYPSHVYQVSCHNGKPEQSNNLAFAILKHTAVSTVASGVQVLYSASMGTLGTKGSARHRGYKYMENLVLNKQVSGEALDGARSELPSNSTTDWLNLVELNLYGCPANGPYVMDAAVSIENVTKNNLTKEFKVKSNTKGDITSFTLNNIEHNGGYLTIFNLNGQKLKTININKNTSQIYINHKKHNISKGLYIYSFQLNTPKGLIESKSSILQL